MTIKELKRFIRRETKKLLMEVSLSKLAEPASKIDSNFVYSDVLKNRVLKIMGNKLKPIIKDFENKIKNLPAISGIKNAELTIELTDGILNRIDAKTMALSIYCYIYLNKMKGVKIEMQIPLLKKDAKIKDIENKLYWIHSAIKRNLEEIDGNLWRKIAYDILKKFKIIVLPKILEIVGLDASEVEKMKAIYNEKIDKEIHLINSF